MCVCVCVSVLRQIHSSIMACIYIYIYIYICIYMPHINIYIYIYIYMCVCVCVCVCVFAYLFPLWAILTRRVAENYWSAISKSPDVSANNSLTNVSIWKAPPDFFFHFSFTSNITCFFSFMKKNDIFIYLFIYLLISYRSFLSTIFFPPWGIFFPSRLILLTF